MNDDERPDGDNTWLDALAGRSGSRTDAGDLAGAEGRVMRRALQRWMPPIDDVAAHDPERVTRLLARARAEGLLPATESRSPVPFPWMQPAKTRWTRSGSSNRRKRFPAWATASVLVIAGIVYLGVSPHRAIEEDRTVRSADGTVVRLKAAEPIALQRRLVTALAEEGLKATPYVRFGRYGIDADLPSPPSPALRALLGREGIPMPNDGVLRVEIEALQR